MIHYPGQRKKEPITRADERVEKSLNEETAQ